MDFWQNRSMSESNYIDAKSKLNWDEYFMLQALIASYRSKDPSTKVGCVFVDSDNHQLSMGYNGFVAGVDENQLPWGKSKDQSLKDQKYAYVVHSEANAILHSKASLKDSRLYVTLFPCHECAKMLATIKIKEIIYLSNKNESKETHDISKKILKLANIKHRKLEIKQDLIGNLYQYLSASIQS